MPLDSLKLNKQLTGAMSDAGYSEPTEILEKSLSRILGGQDIIGIGPEGIGKSSTLVLGVLARLKYAQEEAPRALILVPDKEQGTALAETFQLLGKNTDIRVLSLYAGAGMEGQKDALAEGTDVVIGTPDRVQAIYYKSGLNLNKLKMFILDDADLLLKKGFRPAVHQLSQSIPKCQHLVFSDVAHEKLMNLTRSFMNYPVLVEVFPETDLHMEVVPQILYQVPDYKVKQNLLNFLMMDSEAFTEVVIFTNTRFTAEKVYSSLNRRIKGEVAMFKSHEPETHSLGSSEEFSGSDEIRVLVVALESTDSHTFSGFPVTLFFEVPADPELYIDHVSRKEGEEEDERLVIVFSTDSELSEIKKMEVRTGQKLMVEDLPPGLAPAGRSIQEDEEDPANRKPVSESKTASEKGGAFHEKKASNAKDYNYSYKDKLKRFGKKNRPGKKGIK